MHCLGQSAGGYIRLISTSTSVGNRTQLAHIFIVSDSETAHPDHSSLLLMGTSTGRMARLRKRRRRAELPAQLGVNDEERRFLVARGYLDPLEMAKPARRSIARCSNSFQIR
jgi:hypothetical protein